MDSTDNQQTPATPPEPVVTPPVPQETAVDSSAEFLKYNFTSSEVFNKKAIFNALIGLKSMSTTPTYGELGDIVNIGGVIYICTVASKTAPTWSPLLSTAFDYQVFTVTGSGAWTKPSKASATSMVRVEMWGAGGGGGGKTGGSAIPGGGGGGEYSEGTFRASDLNSSVSLVVGAGGAGGIGNPNSGAAGASSTFGTTLVVARGGSGGSGTNSNGGAGGGYFPGLGGVANPQNALDMFSGGAGGQGSLSGNGGNAYKGGGGGGVGGNGGGGTGGTSAQGGAGGDAPAGDGNGGAGNIPAGGGSGASQNGGATVRTGGAGARGEIRIWTFY